LYFIAIVLVVALSHRRSTHESNLQRLAEAPRWLKVPRPAISRLAGSAGAARDEPKSSDWSTP